MKNLLTTLLICLSFGNVAAQYNDLSFANEIYVDYIKTVEFGKSGIRLSLPMINLNSGQRLFLEFDDREGGYKNYIYKIIHCDKDWYPSDLEELEYIDGFNNEEIDEFAYSVNGYSEYTHYSLTIPNDDIRWTISGNYLLVIYDDDLDVPVLSRRFIVSENQVNVGGVSVKPTDLTTLRTHHQLDLALNLKDFKVYRPAQELFISVYQNANTNYAYHNIQCDYANGTELFFDKFQTQIVFPALKEFRSCDIRNLKYRSEFVYSIEQNDDKTIVEMDKGVIRANKHFQTEPDANGGYIIDNKDYGNGDISGEYADVIFSLVVDQPYLQDVYMVGSFCDWQPKEAYKLEWDSAENMYTKTVSLKQGFYDYMFALLNDEGVLEMAPIEGSWYETENEYQIVVYYRAIGSEYDRVIDVSTIKSSPY